MPTKQPDTDSKIGQSVTHTDQYYFNARQAAVFCGFSAKHPITIYRALREYRESGGKTGLPHTKKGYRTVRIARPDVIAWMEQDKGTGNV